MGRPRNYRFLFSVVTLCVPTLLVIAFAVWFLAERAPEIAASENFRVVSSVGDAARELLGDPSKADFIWRRGEGITGGDKSFAPDFPADRPWKDWVVMSPLRKREKWGCVEKPGGAVVWVRDTRKGHDDETVYGRRTDIVRRDYMTMFSVSVPLALVVLVGMTFFGVKFFADYVRARDDFMSATAHDLTTPLVGMRYMIGNDDGEARILNERMIRLVSNVKDFMRLGGKRRPPELAPCDLRKCYDEAYALFRADYRDLLGGDVGVSGECPPALADATLVVQTIWNLLGNDLKYAAPYGKVSVVFRTEGPFSAVDFVDEGKGMTAKEMSRAFDRYYRAKTVLESGKGGFGIGLCTAREFASAMGGSLRVRANSPRGCVFTLSLPSV